MKRVLLVQPSMQPPGGGNGVAAWVLQALVPGHRVTVLSWRPVDVEPINRFFGTHLKANDFESVVVPWHWRVIPDHLPVPATLIKLSLMMRYTRKVSAGFDVVFGIFNETDYGRKGIQYIHYPTYLRPRPEVDLRWYHAPQGGLNAYYALADRIAELESKLSALESSEAKDIANAQSDYRFVMDSLGPCGRTRPLPGTR